MQVTSMRSGPLDPGRNPPSAPDEETARGLGGGLSERKHIGHARRVSPVGGISRLEQRVSNRIPRRKLAPRTRTAPHDLISQVFLACPGNPMNLVRLMLVLLALVIAVPSASAGSPICPGDGYPLGAQPGRPIHVGLAVVGVDIWINLQGPCLGGGYVDRFFHVGP